MNYDTFKHVTIKLFDKKIRIYVYEGTEIGIK